MKCTAPFLLFQSVRGRIPRCVQSTDPSARFLTGPSCLLAGLFRLLTALDRSVSPPLGQFASASPWPDCPVDRGAVLSCAGGWIVRAGHAALKWSCRPDSAVAVGPDDERGGRLSGRPALLVGCCANQKATVSPLIVTLPKTAVALSLLLPLLTATPRQRVSGSPPSKLSVRTLPKVAPPSSE